MAPLRPLPGRLPAAAASALIDEVLERVLVVAVADSDPDVRFHALSSLDPRFDAHLAQAGKWELLLEALGDQTTRAREAAIKVLGRMSARNPAQLLPALRTQLFDLLTEIEHSSSSRRKEDAARLLRQLVSTSPGLIKPYAATVLHVVQLRLRESASALATIGELSVVAGAAVGPHMAELLHQLLPMLHDHASPYKRRTALHALSQLLRSTGYPAEYYVEGAPKPAQFLLSTLLAMLATEGEPETRIELLRALGTIGAPDPSAQMQMQLKKQRIASQLLVRSAKPGVLPIDFGGGGSFGAGGGDGALAQYDSIADPEPHDGAPPSLALDDEIEPSHPDFYPQLALRVLTRIVRDASLSAHHVMVIRAILGIMWSLGRVRCMPFVPSALPLLLHTSRSHQSTEALREVAVEQIAHLVSIIGIHVRTYVPMLLDLARSHLYLSHGTYRSRMHCLSLLEQLCLALTDEFAQHLPPLMPKLLAILHDDRTEQRLPSLKVLHALEVFDGHLQDHLHLVLPAVLRLCEQHDAPAHARLRSVWLLGRLCQRLETREWASQLVHGIVRVLRAAQLGEQPRVMATLVAVLRSLGPGFAVFACPVQAELKRMHVVYGPFEELIAPLRRSSKGGGGGEGGAGWLGDDGSECSSAHGSRHGGGWLAQLRNGAGGHAGGSGREVALSHMPFALVEDAAPGTSDDSSHSEGNGSVYSVSSQRTSVDGGSARPADGWRGQGANGVGGGATGGGGMTGVGGGNGESHVGCPSTGSEPEQLDLECAEWDWGCEGDPEHAALGLVPVRRARVGGGGQLGAGGGATSGDATASAYQDYSLHPSLATTLKHGPGGQQRLKATWEATQQNTRADWHEWMRRLSVEMLRESPSAPLRACAALAEDYPPLARELFNAAFLSCWTSLDDESGYYHASLVGALETAIDTEDMSLEVLQPLLNLAEFMELADRPLPIDIRKLGALAEKCHAYAKALHYREIEFANFRNLSAGAAEETVEALISINNHLQQPEAAKGVLTYAGQNYQVELKESWYEKLQRWSDAQAAYERKQAEDPNNLAWRLGRMRCHSALGDWETLSELARETWDSPDLGLHAEQTDAALRSEVARLAAAAAWNLRQWGSMAQYAEFMPDGTVETSLVRAVLSVHAGNFAAAQLAIDEARQQLDSAFTALVGESYQRAYRTMVEVLQLAELEEIIMHKQRPNALPMALLTRTWQERIESAQRDADVWQAILAVRNLVVPPANDPRTWLKFCSLCRKAGRSSSLSRKLLAQLLPDGTKSGVMVGSSPSASREGSCSSGSRALDDAFARASPEVAYAHLKQPGPTARGMTRWSDCAFCVRRCCRRHQSALGSPLRPGSSSASGSGAA